MNINLTDEKLTIQNLEILEDVIMIESFNHVHALRSKAQILLAQTEHSVINCEYLSYFIFYC